MEQIISYVKPELLAVSVVLYFIGTALKHLQTVKDKYIPVILGITGIFFAAVYVAATSPVGNISEILMAVFTAMVQGILAAGLSTYVNQIFKQMHKDS